MAKNTGAVVNRIAKVLEMVQEGVYSITEAGELYKGNKLIKGSVGTEDKQRWYSVKGMSIQGQKLMYAYYHGLESIMDANKVVKQLDGDTLNNAKSNLVLVSKNGWKAELEELRKNGGVAIVEAPVTTTVSAPVEPVTEAPTAVTVAVTAPVSAPVSPTLDRSKLNAKQLEAVAIWELLLEGLTIKEVAEKLGVKASRVYDVKRKKSNADVTNLLPALV